jgi:hypothetical protein
VQQNGVILASPEGPSQVITQRSLVDAVRLRIQNGATESLHDPTSEAVLSPIRAAQTAPVEDTFRSEAFIGLVSVAGQSGRTSEEQIGVLISGLGIRALVPAITPLRGPPDDRAIASAASAAGKRRIVPELLSVPFFDLQAP